MLIEHIRRQINARHGVRIDGVTDDALRCLAGYSWPGNVRELEAVLEEAMLLRGRGWLRPEDVALPAPIRDPGPLNAPLLSIPAADARRQRVLALAANPTGVSTSQLARAMGVGLTLAREQLGR